MYAPHFDGSRSFKIEVETFCRHFTQKEKVAKLEVIIYIIEWYLCKKHVFFQTFGYLPVCGPVRLKDPDICLQYIEYYGTMANDPPELPYEVFFGRCVSYFYFWKKHEYNNDEIRIEISIL